MLDVRRMQMLRAVVSSGSVTAAAENLGYTPSAVSQQVAALERQTGVPLLERVGRGVRPTAAGRLLTEHADVISRNLAEAETALADLRAGRTGTLSVRYFATAGAALVPPAVARFRAEFPGVQLDLKLIDPQDPLPEVERGGADLAIVVRADATPPSPAVRLVHLLDDPMRAVLPRGHRLAAKRVIDLADLAEEPWICNERVPGTCMDVVLDACGAAGFSPNFTVLAEDYATARGFVAAGLGVSVIPQLGIEGGGAVAVRRIRRPEPVRSIYAAVRATAHPSAALNGLIDALRSAARG